MAPPRRRQHFTLRLDRILVEVAQTLRLDGDDQSLPAYRCLVGNTAGHYVGAARSRLDAARGNREAAPLADGRETVGECWRRQTTKDTDDGDWEHGAYFEFNAIPLPVPRIADATNYCAGAAGGMIGSGAPGL